MVVREPTVRGDVATRSPASADFGWQRWAAALAVILALASVTTHVWMLSIMPSTAVLHVVVLAMAAACLWCGISLMRAPRLREWTATAVMGAAMVGTHLMLTGAHGAHHAMSGSMSPDSTSPDSMSPGVMAASMPTSSAAGAAMSVSMVLAVAEILVALAVIWRVTARR